MAAARSRANTDTMSPLATLTNDMLKQTVYYHLDNSSYDNALFFAERLCAQDKTTEASESTFLLATCYLRLGDDRSAYHVSKAAGYRGTHLGCSYIFAQSCLRLGLCKEGITALERSKHAWATRNNMGKHAAGLRVPHPDASACSCLLGKLYRGYEDKKRAVECFEESLTSNPMMWDAFTSLCDMGVKVRVGNIFKSNETLVKNFDQTATRPPGARREGSSSSVESLQVPKKSSRSAPQAQGPADPFDAPRSNAYQDIPSFSNLQSADTEGNDFMSKIVAARSRQGRTVVIADGMETPTGSGGTGDVPSTRTGTGPEPPQAPTRQRRPIHGQSDPDAPPRMGYRLNTKRRQEVEEATNSGTATLKASSITERKRTVSGQPVQSRPMNGEEQGHRRSARLNLFNKPTAKANPGASAVGASNGRDLKRTKAGLPGTRLIRSNPVSNPSVGRVVSGNRRSTEDTNMDVDNPEVPPTKEPITTQRVPQKPADPEPNRSAEALKAIMDLLGKFGHGYQQLSQFHCQEALNAFNQLPKCHQDTPWVLAQLGRAQYEQAAYPEAERYFRRLRIMSPTRMQDMEVYSTILWHLKRETDLSFLAHELIDSAWLSPEAWCALGNAWSLAKDHEQSLRCFKRATQLDPKFAYAYTLQGHEHMANEEYDKALTAFRLSISADRRHYNAYYGIGMVYEKLGNYEKALHHFKAAQQIHPTNAVLICCMGTVLEKQKDVMQALKFFSKATELAPRAAQARFRKARALLATGQLQLAQHELLILKDLAPDDARVHFLLGKLYKAQNDKSQAVRHFTQALSLDPKASQQIKEAIESLEDDDGLEDSMMQ